MKSILLIGLGRFGTHLAAQLNRRGHQVMGIDKNEERVNETMRYLTDAQIGDSTNEDLLSALEVSSFDVCFVTIGKNFQSSLETTCMLKELGAPFVVARASCDAQAKFLLRNGADEVLYPEKQLAGWAAIKYGSKNLLDYIEIDEDTAIFEVPVPMLWVGHSIGKIDVRKKHSINIIAIKQNGKLSGPVLPDTVLTKDMALLVMGDYKTVQKCFHL
ncbi:MAG: TrkA family potassium uptake protein [Eubacterium sp.]|nr:TrkA family potassium uptake protein [Eubacterium sp.]MBR7072282.1 TrkA family potassium uptake protein [Eubacterium sp.]